MKTMNIHFITNFHSEVWNSFLFPYNNKSANTGDLTKVNRESVQFQVCKTIWQHTKNKENNKSQRWYPQIWFEQIKCKFLKKNSLSEVDKLQYKAFANNIRVCTNIIFFNRGWVLTKISKIRAYYWKNHSKEAIQLHFHPLNRNEWLSMISWVC